MADTVEDKIDHDSAMAEHGGDQHSTMVDTSEPVTMNCWGRIGITLLTVLMNHWKNIFIVILLTIVFVQTYELSGYQSPIAVQTPPSPPPPPVDPTTTPAPPPQRTTTPIYHAAKYGNATPTDQEWNAWFADQHDEVKRLSGCQLGPEEVSVIDRVGNSGDARFADRHILTDHEVVTRCRGRCGLKKSCVATKTGYKTVPVASADYDNNIHYDKVNLTQDLQCQCERN